MVSRSGGVALVLVLVLATAPAVWAAAPTTVGRAAPGHPPAAPTAPATVGHNDPGPPQPQVSQDAAARARMHECAHQWSSIKKAGNAGATTWKEFSATCLVVSR